jgi:hypothetical protein
MSKPQDPVRPEGLDKFKEKKKFNYLIGTGTRDLAACSIVPQPSTVQHTEHNNNNSARIIIKELKTEGDSNISDNICITL